MSEEGGGGGLSSKCDGGVRRRLDKLLKKDTSTSRRSLPIAMPHKLIPIDNDGHYTNVNANLQQSTPKFQPVVYRHDNDNSVAFDDNDNMTTAATASSSCYYRPSCYYSHDPCAAGSKLLAIMFSCGPLLQ